MKSELGTEIECLGKLTGLESGDPDSKSGDPDSKIQPQSDGWDWRKNGYGMRVRSGEENGFAVYTRNKRLKSGKGGEVGCLDIVFSDAAVLNAVGISESTLELKEESAALPMNNFGGRRFTRSSLKWNEEASEMKNGREQNGVAHEVEEVVCEEMTTSDSPAKKMELKMSKKILIKGRPTTVRELFDTGLLEGYPVFYNGGKRGFPLRGTIKDGGIICSCSLCKGVTVVPPCQFEIHACKVYRRASQYICLDNGKSLLDVVKECQKASINSLDETIVNIIGPMPVMESVICNKCRESFLATSTTKVDPLCDSCMISVNSDADFKCVQSGPLDPLFDVPTSENTDKYITPQKKSRRGRKKIKNFLSASITKCSVRSSKAISTRKSRLLKMSTLRLKQNSTSKSPASASMRFSKSTSEVNIDGIGPIHGLENKTGGKISKKMLLPSTDSLSKSLEIGSPSVSMKSKSSWKITKKDQRMHRLVFEDGGLPDGTEVAYYSHGKRLRDGYKMGSGIFCRCCNSQVSPSQFEAHAGWASRRRPYMYIYTSNGVSLHEFAISLLKGRKGTAKDNDDLCIICADGGKLVLCDGCPRAFHRECASLLSIPRGKWYCTYCQNMFQREKFVECNANAVAAGRVSGVDPIEQITNRCIRIVKSPKEDELIACVICRGYDFSKSGFGPRTVILCDQCEREYHVGCLKKSRMSDLKELPKGKWFCSGDCRKIYCALQNLLNSGSEKISDVSLDVIRKKQEEKNGLRDNTDLDVRWRLLNGKNNSRETRVLLSQAVAIFHECFDPIVDSETGRDFIPSMVYGRNTRGQDFSGMYCMILTVNSMVVSAGILRIFGQEMAELPLAATRFGNQGKGYFQMLFTCIEKLLAFLNVKLWVLPAADEAKSIWTKKFGFATIPPEQLSNYRKICWQMISFKGTSMLEKRVPKCVIINQDKEDVP